jgi:hypothetical protein
MMTAKAETTLSIINPKPDKEMKIPEVQKQTWPQRWECQSDENVKPEKEKMDATTGKRGGA